MSEIKKPRMCEILGLKVNEPFVYPRITDIYDDFTKCWIDQNGVIQGIDKFSNVTCAVSGQTVCWLIDNPEKIVRLSPLTEPELAICKAVGAKWVSMDKGNDKHMPSEYVDLWNEKPEEDEGIYNCDSFLGEIVQGLFPSVRPGDCIEITDKTEGVANSG